MRVGRRDVGERHLHPAGNQVGENHASPLVGCVHELGAGHQLEQLAGQVRHAAVAGGGHGQFARLALGQRDELQHRLHGEILADQHQIGRFTDQAHRSEVLDGIVGKVLEQSRVDRMGAGSAGNQGIAIRGCFGHHGRTDRAAPPRPIFDDHADAQPVRDSPGREPPENVGTSSRRKGNAHSDLLTWIFIRNHGGACAQAASCHEPHDSCAQYAAPLCDT